MIKPADYSTKLRERRWLSEGTFELYCDRPRAFAFRPGQKIRVEGADESREYSIASAPTETTLNLCIRNIEDGRISAMLSSLELGSKLSFNGPYGYFNYMPAERQAVFVATGTGIAPFAAMCRSGVKDFILLHGVSRLSELYYRRELETTARQYIPCISDQAELPEGLYAGRVTDFLKTQLPVAVYDFYLCGSGAMIRDVTLLVDGRFEGSRVFTEKFY